jgi:thiosulfate/3-mercaptopyruvate sulfurtransferase
MQNRMSCTAARWVIASVTVLLLASAATAQNIDPAALIQPETLARQLQSGGTKPIILYVGPKFLYTQAHLPGAEFIGPASNPQSMEELKKRVAALPKNSQIVLYCGCCPWDHCPNIRPAYGELHKLGFTNLKAVYMPTSLGKDWVEKGYPVEKGEAGSK